MSFFVTGTDTGVGKTLVTLALLEGLKQRGYSVCGMKPVACGCEKEGDQLRNDDALKIMAQIKSDLDYKLINPYALATAAAPVFAAADDNNPISINTIANAYAKLRGEFEIMIVEGLGGWRMPLNDKDQMSDLVKALNLRVILVVGLRLGCINHALLTRDAIIEDGLELCGWIANALDPSYDRIEQTCELLTSSLGTPMLGVLPYQQKPDLTETVSHLRLNELRIDIENINSGV
jgi:dethiobiotin synthetase